MNLNITKEEILQIKLNLFKVVKNKNAAAIAQNWEHAAKCREEEKIVREKFEGLKNEIINELTNLKKSSDNIDDYVLLQGLLFEFHSAEFYDDCCGVKNMGTIESHAKKYWNLRDQMHQELMDFLSQEYAFLKEQMHQSVKEGDQAKGKMVVSRLAAIGDFIIKNRRYLQP